MILEDKLVKLCKQDNFSLAETLIFASSLDNETRATEYMQKFRIKCCQPISERYTFQWAEDNLDKALVIFDKPCRDKPKRATYIDDIDFLEVIERQLSNDDCVGSCYGLTLLYAAICDELGVETVGIVDHYEKKENFMEAFRYDRLSHMCDRI